MERREKERREEVLSEGKPLTVPQAAAKDWPNRTEHIYKRRELRRG